MTNAERRGEGTAVRTKAGPLPALVPLISGAVIITLSVVRVAFGVDGRPYQLLFELGICGVGAALVLWGWWLLRRAKTAHLGQTWRQFLGADLTAMGIAVALMVCFFSLSPEQRDGLQRSFWELLELFSLAWVR